MARAAKPAIPAKPAAVARAPPALLGEDEPDPVAAAPPEPPPVVAVAVVPVVTVPPDFPPDVVWTKVSTYDR